MSVAAMDSTLPLRSFEVKGYRALRSLSLPVLGRVNLFVGRNNVGKTALLEVLRVYRSSNPRLAFNSLIRQRGGYSARLRPMPSSGEINPLAIESLLQSIESLFHGSISGVALAPIHIRGSLNDPEAVTISYAASRARIDEDLRDGDAELLPETPLLEITSRGRKSVVPMSFFLKPPLGGLGPGNSRVMLITPAGPDRYSVGQLWDRAVEQGSAPDVEAALRTIVPDLVRVHQVGKSDTQDGIYLELEGAPRPVPLKNRFIADLVATYPGRRP
jgi:hypothetical protein